MPYIAYCHGEQITQTEQYRFQPALRNWIYRHADAVIANSGFTVNHLLRVGIPEDRIHKITPGVDFDRFSPRPKNADLVKRFGLEGKSVVLTVARLIPRKGHAAVLHSLARISKDVPNLVYLIAGAGPEEQPLRHLAAELGIGEIVKFAGRVPEETLPDFFNLCDVFAMPNYDGAGGDIEGFGMVFLEANAAGKPVIGGRSGGSSDAVAHGETGFLVDTANLEDLVSTLRRLLQDKDLRERLGSAGLERARTQFSWEARARALRAVSLSVWQSSAKRPTAS
jgi:phosphatidylinositol alpha-1,6-mannosyltransferase